MENPIFPELHFNRMATKVKITENLNSECSDEVIIPKTILKEVTYEDRQKIMRLLKKKLLVVRLSQPKHHYQYDL